MKVIFMGTPGFAIPALDALHQAGHEIVAVYTQPPRPAGRGQKERSSQIQQRALELELTVHSPASLKSTEIQKSFRAHGAEIAVVAAYGLILPQAILDSCPRGCLNIHPSLLPRWRGAAPIQRTLIAGDTKTGVCIMQMDAGLDTGDVLLCETVDIPPMADAGQLHDLLADKGASLLVDAINALEKNALEATPQSAKGVTYAEKISKEESRIDWSQTAQEIQNHIRGLSPFPGATTLLNGETLKIFAGEIAASPAPDSVKPGEIIDEYCGIACGNGLVVHPQQMQRPGKRRMEAAEVLKGLDAQKGMQFQ